MTNSHSNEKQRKSHRWKRVAGRDLIGRVLNLAIPFMCMLFASRPAKASTIDLGTIDLAPGETVKFEKQVSRHWYYASSRTSSYDDIRARVKVPLGSPIIVSIKPNLTTEVLNWGSGSAWTYTNYANQVRFELYTSSGYGDTFKAYQRTMSQASAKSISIPETPDYPYGRDYYIRFHQYRFPIDPGSQNIYFDVTFTYPVPPAQPSYINATASGGRIEVAWGTSKLATHYRLYKYCDEAFVTKMDVTNTVYRDTDVSTGHNYQYYVDARNEYGTSEMLGSLPVNLSSVAKPTAPTSISATTSLTNGIKVTWSGGSGATSFNVWRGTSSTRSAASKIKTGATSPYLDTSSALVTGTQYYYWVEAVNSAGSAYSSYDWGKKIAPTPNPPTAPTSISATTSLTNGIQLSWSGGSGATSFNVWRGTSSTRSAASKIKTGATSPYLDTSSALVTGTQYYYWVEAVNSAGSAYSSYDWGKKIAPTPNPPTAPTSISATTTLTNGIQVTWSGGSGATSFNVWRGTSSTRSAASKIKTGATSPYLDTSSALVAGTQYYYWVEAVNSAGSAYSSYACGKKATSPSGTLPDAVDNTSLSFTTGGDASWFRQTTNTHDNVDAAQSGTISNNQTSWMQTTVSGPGTVTFWWYVSSEGNATATNGWYDYLAFSVDETQKARIKGTNAAWAKVMVEVSGSGTHALKWIYRKDGSLSKGCDCGWVDQITWTSGSPSPVYRFYSTRTKGHFYTMNETEMLGLKNKTTSSNWDYEGIAYYAYPSQVSGTVPLYRFWSDVNQGHFYTTSETEMLGLKNKTTSKNWNYNGIAYYVYPSAVSGASAVYRFWSPSAKHHFYTMSYSEMLGLKNKTTSKNWNYERIAFYALETSAKSGNARAKAATPRGTLSPAWQSGERIFSVDDCGVFPLGAYEVEISPDEPAVEELEGLEDAEELPEPLAVTFRVPEGGAAWQFWSAERGLLAEDGVSSATIALELPDLGLWHWLRFFDENGGSLSSTWFFPADGE